MVELLLFLYIRLIPKRVHILIVKKVLLVR